MFTHTSLAGEVSAGIQLKIDSLEERARAGDREAQLELSNLYFESADLEEQAQSIRWLTLASDHGSPEAQLRLARCYSRGIGTEKDYEVSRMHYHLVLTNPEATPEHISTAEAALATMNRGEKIRFYSDVVYWLVHIGDLLGKVL